MEGVTTPDEAKQAQLDRWGLGGNRQDGRDEHQPNKTIRPIDR
jgi:hypothetical protein